MAASSLSRSTSRFAKAVALTAALFAACGHHQAPAAVVDAFGLGHWRVSVVIQPARAGTNQLHLTFARGRVLADDVADAHVEVNRRDVPLAAYGAGHYAAQTNVFDHGGRWVALVSATGKDGTHYAHRFAFSISP